MSSISNGTDSNQVALQIAQQNAHTSASTASHEHSKAVNQTQNAQNTQGAGGPGTTDAVGGVKHAQAPNGGKVTSDAPELPGTEGPQAPTKQVADVGSSLTTYGMAWQSLEAMSDGANLEFQQQSKLKIFAQKAKTSEKDTEIKDSIDQINGQREAAVNNLAGAVFGAVASGGLGLYGNKLQMTGDAKSQSAGASIQALGQVSGQVFTTGAKALDTTMGGQYDADQAGIAVKRDQKAEDISQQLIDSAGSFVTAAQQEWQKAQQTITDMTERKMQASNNVANQ